MKRFLFIIVLSMLLVSCQKDELTKHLETGLVKYERARPVNKNLINGISIEKFAIFKTGEDTYSLVLKLNDDVEKLEVDKYQLAIESYLDEKNTKLRSINANKNNNKQGFNFDAELESFKGHKYIINKIQTDIKAFERLDIWFYQMENGIYKDVGGNRITIRNIGL